ncbi:MAG TPA: hypothetical protein VKX28_13740 [Xanthobacteraceae bacterium]|nr:hypothetical protein [Xanthobacteraceae bacterium]
MSGIGHLPSRFPVGTRYVLEGVPAEPGQTPGQVRVISRMVVLPNGQQFDLTQASAEPAMQRRVRRSSARRRNKR